MFKHFKEKLAKEKPIVIGICGRSCSGKSRVTRKIAEKYSDKITRIPLDRFFLIYNTKELDETDGWESPNSVRWDRFIRSVKKLKNGESTHIPSKGWTEVFDQKVYPKKIILVEGYLIYTNKELLELFDKKIFVEVSDLNILYRRTLRDGVIDGMNYTMRKVIPISKRYEDKQKNEADTIIDGNKSKDDLLNDFEKIIKGFL
jgi:uridine kinase